MIILLKKKISVPQISLSYFLLSHSINLLLPKRSSLNVSLVQYETRLRRREEHNGAIPLQLPLHHRNLTIYFTISSVNAAPLFTTSSSLNFIRLQRFAFALQAQYCQLRDLIFRCTQQYKLYIHTIHTPSSNIMQCKD
jgi:hypothetical protein